MLTITVRAGYRVLALAGVLLLAACAAKPVYHEFPQSLAVEMRPPSQVAYTLRETESASGDWVLRGSQGDAVGGFRYWPGTGEAVGSDSRFQDGINQVDYLLRPIIGGMGGMGSWGHAPPKVAVFNAASGELVGELELRTGFDRRFEGIWRGRRVLWRASFLPAAVVPREPENIEDHFPAAQLLEWTGGSSAGLRIYGGRALASDPPAFTDAIFDVTAGRPLTRRELGDSIVFLFAIRTLEQAMGAVKAASENE